MPFRNTVRKLSSKSAMDTPIFVAWAVLVISAAMAAARSSFFMQSSCGERPAAPDVVAGVEKSYFCHIGPAGPIRQGQSAFPRRCGEDIRTLSRVKCKAVVRKTVRRRKGHEPGYHFRGIIHTRSR